MHRFMVFALFLPLLRLIGGCAGIRAQEMWAAADRAEAIARECREKRLRGELPGYVASAQCSESRMRVEYAKAGYPYMDLINLSLAHRMAGAKRVDAGEMVLEDLKLQHSELTTRIQKEAIRHDLANQGSAAKRTAAIGPFYQGWGSLMQGLAAWQQTVQPQYKPIT